MYALIEIIWKEKTIPAEWNKAIIRSKYKKVLNSPIRTFGEYRTSIYKLYPHILNQRLHSYAGNIIREYQAGFRKGKFLPSNMFYKSTLDKHMTLSIEFNSSTSSGNSICREATLTNIEASVRMQNQFTENFEITQGLNHGAGLVPKLFNLTREYVLRRTGVDDAHLF